MNLSTETQRCGELGAAPSKQARVSGSGFWNLIAEHYAAKGVANEAAYQQKLSLTQQYLSAQDEILEIGCGTGSTAIEHASSVRQITATDFSHQMIAIAKRKASAAQVRNIEFVECEASAALEAGAAYDGVLALNVLHLLKDWRSVVCGAGQSLLSGGVFVSSTPCLRSLPGGIRALLRVGSCLGVLPRLMFFTRDDLKSALESAGFAVEYEWQADSRNVFLIGRKP
ncbi:MAG: class I SAM-dependent methyltransferase [Pseudomonadota bacterium]